MDTPVARLRSAPEFRASQAAIHTASSGLGSWRSGLEFTSLLTSKHSDKSWSFLRPPFPFCALGLMSSGPTPPLQGKVGILPTSHTPCLLPEAGSADWG